MTSIEVLIAQRRALVGRVKGLLIDTLQLDLTPEEIAEDGALFGFGLGLDSIDALSLVVSIEDTFAVSIPDDGVAMLRSINTVADFVAAHGTMD